MAYKDGGIIEPIAAYHKTIIALEINCIISVSTVTIQLHHIVEMQPLFFAGCY
jgi:hypothetical protein